MQSVADQLRRAVAAGDDAACAGLLAQASLTSSPAALLPVTFEELAARGLALSAVALASIEAGGQELREVEATAAGGSYLHAVAAAGASAAVVHGLVAAGCAVNGHDGAGDTPLHVAAAAGHLDTCRALLGAGADALARNANGRTPRMQGGVPGKAKALLEEREAAVKREREAMWGAKIQATQTQSACRLGCL